MKTKFCIICIACVYRSTSLSDNLNSQLTDCISSICKETNDYETILTGDFNLPDVSWENGNVIGVFVYPMCVAVKQQLTLNNLKYVIQYIA